VYDENSNDEVSIIGKPDDVIGSMPRAQIIHLLIPLTCAAQVSGINKCMMRDQDWNLV